MGYGTIERIIEEEKNEVQTISNELSKNIESIIRRRLKEQSRNYENRLNEKYKEISLKEEQIRELESSQEALLKKIKWQNKSIKSKDIKKIVERNDEYINSILEKTPPKGWHCANVGNWTQVSEAEREMEEYGSLQDPEYVGVQLARLIRLVERFERECETIDQDMIRFVSQLIASRLNASNRGISYLGIDFYNCPHCGKHLDGFQDHVTKLAKTISPESIADTKPYPKVKIENISF